MKKLATFALTALVAATAAVAVALSPPQPPPQAVAAVAPLKIMTMGDSITCGDGCTPTSSYRTELGRLLTQAGVEHEFIVAAVGSVGCNYWVPRAYALTAQYLPDLVLLNCGTNDGPTTSAAGSAFETTYRNLLTNLLSGGQWHTRVVPAYPSYAAIGGYPFPNKAPSWLATSMPIVNDAIWRSLNVNNPHGTLRIPSSVDLQQIPEQYLDEGGLHPTTSGYTLTGRLWYNALRPLYGWPALTGSDAIPCGMSGRRPGWGSPPYAPIRPGCPVV